MCEKCNGSGFILVNRDGYDFAVECECRQTMLADARRRASGIGEAYKSKRISNYETKGNELLTKARNMAQAYIDGFADFEKSNKNSAMFLGTVGSGKTHLSLAIANELLDKGVKFYYMPYRETMMELKQNAIDNKYKYEELMYKLTTARVLVIDDLFKGKITDTEIGYVFQIVNQRYLNGLPFVLSSEKMPDGLMAIDEAIASRLIEQAKGRIAILNDERLNHRLYE